METEEYFSILTGILSEVDHSKVRELLNLIKQAGQNGKFIYTCGNGGSGANASHFTQDLLKCPIKDFSSPKQRFKTVCLNDNTPVLMAYANDLAYDQVFMQQLMNFCQPGDLLLGLSGSGNSMNVVKALEYANSAGAITFAVVGFDGGKLLSVAKNSLHIKTNNMQAYEDASMAVLHGIVTALKPS